MKLVGASLLLVAVSAAWSAPPRHGAKEPVRTGEQLFRACIACHSLEAGDHSPAGPSLNQLAGRRIAGESGFDYSPALRRLADRHGHWSTPLLDRFLADPESLAPGTEMGFPGMASQSDRSVLINWLSGAPDRRH